MLMGGRVELTMHILHVHSPSSFSCHPLLFERIDMTYDTISGVSSEQGRDSEDKQGMRLREVLTGDDDIVMSRD